MSNAASAAPKSPNIKLPNSTANTNIKNIAMNTANNITNTMSTAANSIKNGAATVANNIKNSAVSAVNSMGNSFKSVQNMTEPIADSISESVAAVPSTAPSLYVMLPLIIGIGVLIIVLTLVIYYRTAIGNAFDTMKTNISNYFSPPPPPPPPVVDEQELNTVNQMVGGRKTVFNVNSNKYTYSDAEPLCKALGAELATYDQVKKAWDQGADWCNYGWIKGQAAVYPTQKSTYDALQQSSVADERMACGRVGINGGHMDNPDLRYGVNCYGDKPSQTDHDIEITNERMQPPLTSTALKQKMIELEFKANSNLIGLLPFNSSKW